ncbi:MAG TPA: LysR family transcriptional regulator [Gemmatimonadales bacterium]|jgi:DNA-binding transcriptional LysR family regulator|nr:LysR family transcriptional regulator [Gemmatimonadales bacterium]
MELRHLRYFVAVAEERSFIRASTRLRIAQPALSKQIRDLEIELGTVLLERGPRGVSLTAAGRAFLVEARRTLDVASHAVASARGAAVGRDSPLRFVHGELAAYGTTIENLLASFRDANPDAQVEVSSNHDGEIFHALRERRVDIGSIFTAEWPVPGFAAHRLIDTTITGVLLPGSHPLAAQPCIRLAQLRTLTWLNSAPQRWPGFFPVLEAALRERGLVPERQLERSRAAPTMNMQIAAGDTWTLVTEAVAAPYRQASNGIVYRPFREPPIPCWLALVWLPPTSHTVKRLAQRARDIGLSFLADD